MGLAAALAPALLAVSGEAEAKSEAKSEAASEPAGLYGGAKPLRRPPELAQFLAETPPEEDSVGRQGGE